uniref:EF-hand domain-containing protein n=1 Tax=Rhizophora mucronata TaxID=61149 RepID=A0A2P2KYL6_RHIMU
MSGYPPSGYGYGYGGSPPPQPYGSAPPPYGAPPPQQPYGASSAPYGAPSAPYGAPSAPYGSPYAPAGAPSGEKPHKDKPSQHGGAPAPAPAPGGYPPQPGQYGSPFAALLPSAFPPGTDPNVVACFQAADQDGSGFIDDKELQRALSGYNQSFSMRTVHLLMYLFTNSNTRKIGPKEFTQVFYSLQNWRASFLSYTIFGHFVGV